MNTDEEGIATVTIPASEYAALLECQKRETARSASRPARSWDVPPSSPLARDAEVIAFFTERIGIDVLKLIHECRNRFGTARTPSRTAIYYFWKRLRQEDHVRRNPE